MPSRLLRESILDSESVNKLSAEAEVFYRRLMSVVDDHGRFDARPAILRSRLYSLQLDRVREAGVVRWLSECESANLIRLYTVSGKPYLSFPKLGTPRAEKSKYPAPPGEGGPDLPQQTSVSSCAQVKTDENGCAQPETGAPGSDSYSGTGTNSGSNAKKTPLPPKGGAGEGQGEPVGFLEFWEAYPKKASKGAARRVWKRLRPDKNLLREIVRAIESQARSEPWQREGGRFIPNPATWLNGECWEDRSVPATHAAVPSQLSDQYAGLRAFAARGQNDGEPSGNG